MLRRDALRSLTPLALGAVNSTVRGGGRAAGALGRFAFVIVVCRSLVNGTDASDRGNSVAMQLRRAKRLRRSLDATGTDVHTIALVHALGAAAQRELREAGWQTVDVAAGETALGMKPILAPENGLHWPRGSRPNVQVRRDCGCTGLKLLAWGLLAFVRVFVSDGDTCYDEDPLPWIEAQHARGEYFVAAREQARRSILRSTCSRAERSRAEHGVADPLCCARRGGRTSASTRTRCW